MGNRRVKGNRLLHSMEQCGSRNAIKEKKVFHIRGISLLGWESGGNFGEEHPSQQTHRKGPKVRSSIGENARARYWSSG